MQAMRLTTALLAAGVAAQNPGNKPVFLYPADGSQYIYNKLDTVVVTYTVEHNTAELYTFCDPGRETMMDWQTVPGFSASVPVLLNFTSDTPCWFDIRTGPNGINGRSSAWFHVLNEERSTGRQTFGADSDTPRSTPSSTSPAGTTTRRNPRRAATTNDSSSSSSAPSFTPTPDPNESSTPTPEEGEAEGGGGMGYWTATGIGFGAGLGLAALMGLGFMCWCRQSDRQARKSKKTRERDLEARRAEDFYRRQQWARSEQAPDASPPPIEPGGRWFRGPLAAPGLLGLELGSTLNAAGRDAAEGDVEVGNSAQKGDGTGTGDASEPAAEATVGLARPRENVVN